MLLECAGEVVLPGTSRGRCIHVCLCVCPFTPGLLSGWVGISCGLGELKERG